jgi:hypothetical protein
MFYKKEKPPQLEAALKSTVIISALLSQEWLLNR